MTSIKDVARAANVSVTTVSFALNNKGNISEETRQRVLQTAQQLGYTPSINAQNFRTQSSRVIGYAWKVHRTPAELSPMLNLFLHEVIRLTEARDFHLMLFESTVDSGLDLYSKLTKSGRVDGIILADPVTNDERVKYLLDEDFPFVMFGRTRSPMDNVVNWVDVDGKTGIYKVMEHLIAMGHKRIAMIGWYVGITSSDDRFRGYVDALEDHLIPYDETLVKESRNLPEDGYSATADLMTLNHPPTAIVASSDTIAIGTLRYLSQYGLKVAVTGFDNIPTAEFHNPPLTTIRQPLKKSAALLVKLLFNTIQNKNANSKNYLLSPELVIRESSLIKLKNDTETDE